MFYKLRCKIIAWLYALLFIEDIADIEDEIPEWYAKIQFKEFNKWLSENWGIEYKSEKFNKNWFNEIEQVFSDINWDDIIEIKSASSK